MGWRSTAFLLFPFAACAALLNLTATPLLGLSQSVSMGAIERDLIGLGFDPNFAQTGLFYILSTRRPDGASVIARFRAPINGEPADPASGEWTHPAQLPIP